MKLVTADLLKHATSNQEGKIAAIGARHFY